MSTARTSLPRKLPTSFDGLVAVMVPHAILDDADYGNVAELLNRLAMLSGPTPGQSQYLATLEALVEAYDREHADPLLSAGRSSPLDRLKFLMASAGLGVSDIGKIIGSVPAASMVLKGHRELSKDHIRKLSAHFNVSADYFL